jgi:uncharacterized Zn-finger protein
VSVKQEKRWGKKVFRAKGYSRGLPKARMAFMTFCTLLYNVRVLRPFCALYSPFFAVVAVSRNCLMSSPAAVKNVVEIDANDLPLHCPTASDSAWNHHPRVYLDIAHSGEVTCPWCGTTYRLKPGTVLKGHH